MKINRDKFIEKYRLNHYFCPKCHCKNYSITLAAYLFDERHPEEYKDKNSVTCQICGWRGIRHDLIPKSEKTGFKIFYSDQLSRAHDYDNTIYNTKEEAKEICESLNNKYQKYVHIEFYPYEIKI